MSKITKKSDSAIALFGNNTNNLIDQLQKQLDEIKKPSKTTIRQEVNGTILNDVEDVKELILLRIEVKRLHELISTEIKEISSKLLVKIPYDETGETVSEKIEAIDTRISTLMQKEKIQKLEEAIKKAREMRSEEEKKEAFEAERMKTLGEIANLISID